LSTTGGSVWGAAEAAIAFFEQHWDSLVPPVSVQRPVTRVIELGAGCGKLGLTVALNAGARCSVLLTEQPDGLAHLDRNVRLNRADGVDARAVACDWGDFDRDGGAADAGKEEDEDEDEDDKADDALSWRSCARVAPQSLPRADVIIGSDLIYLPEGARALPRTIAALLRAGRRRRRRGSGGGSGGGGELAPVAFYSHTKHRFDALDVALEEQCAACGLEMVELDPATGSPWAEEGDGDRGRPRSPPPFTELYPEHRVAVYRLRLV
jgi:hypothetical protein